ncbi:hypothetical protein AB0C51_16940 [Streptomyces pathocidini]|uniref:hypothetical protein n=1 Tax=Streptomyces pathocidini TaxID=1650571 RepID=UPI003410EA53
MDYEPLAAAVVAASGLAGLFVQARRPNVHAAEEIKRELDILASLPEDSRLRAPLQNRVEDSLRRYMAGAVESRTRNWAGITTNVILCIGAAFFVWMAVANGAWWWAGLIIAVPFGAIGLISFPDAFIKAERDVRGRRIDPASPARSVTPDSTGAGAA